VLGYPDTALTRVNDGLALAERVKQFGWSCEQVSFEATQTDPRDVNRVMSALQNCDVLIGLGDFLLFFLLSDAFGDEGVKLVCRVMGLPGKPDAINGVDVDRYFREGRIREIAEYCESDVVNTYRIWLRHELLQGHNSCRPAFAPGAKEDNTSQRSTASSV
jgi:Predicted 3'-5' exonuclease related to the exonuclease domain of PolB